MKLQVSVVIPTFNRPQLALKNAAIIRKFHKDVEIIIVDQESNSKIDEKEAKNKGVKYINLKTANTSIAKNTGVKNASGEIVFFFDDDVEITKDTIPAQLEAYEDPEIVGTAGRVINDHEEVPANTDVTTGRTNFLASKFIQQFWSTKKQNVDFAYGCNMSYRRKIFLEAGGFDKSFPKIFEEIDLGQRLKKYGTLQFVPNALAYHHKAKSGGTRTSIKEKMSLIYKTYGYYMAKRVIFPLSLITLALRTRTARFEAPFAVKDLYRGYWEYIRKQFTWENILLFGFLILILVMRLWKVPEWFSFNFDEEYQASLAWEQIKNFHPLWIGVSASNIGYYLGPGFTYLNALLFAISRGDPVILGYFSAIFGLVTMASIYFITNDLFGRRAAVVAAVVYGGSAFLIFFDRRFWNPTPIPFISVWFVYTLIKAQRNPRWFIWSTIIYASFFHIHLAPFMLAPLLLYAIITNFKKIKLPTWIPMIVSYLIITFPLLVFDIVHKFSNVLAPIKYIFFKEGEYTEVSTGGVVEHARVLANALGKIWFVKIPTALQTEHCLGQHCSITIANPLLIIVSLITLGILVAYFRKGYQYGYLVAAILIYCAGFIFYPGFAAEYYMIGLYALFTIAIGVVLAKLPKFAVYILLTLFLLANAATIFTSTQEKYGLMVRKKLIEATISVVGNQPYALETYGNIPRKYPPYGGWRYLFKTYGKNTPAISFADDSFGWIFTDELNQATPKLKVVITDDKNLQTDQKPIAHFKEGIYQSYIFPFEK